MNKKKMITGSIVTYKNPEEDIKNVIKSFFNTRLNVKLYIIDNSLNRDIEKICLDSRINYYNNNNNLGFGKGHNIAIKKAIKEGSRYHVVLNPDIYFEKDIFKEIVKFMDKNIDVGMMMPKIKFPNGDDQQLCKLLPTPFDLFQRRFLPRWDWAERLNSKYEMNFIEDKEIIESPYLSGCFMFIRTDVLKEIGLFDERIFMYSEDLDLTRRIHMKYRTIMYSKVEIFHKWERGSYKNKKLLWEQIKSNIYYFNKYGWFIDRERKSINKKILRKHLMKSRRKDA